MLTTIMTIIISLVFLLVAYFIPFNNSFINYFLSSIAPIITMSIALGAKESRIRLKRLGYSHTTINCDFSIKLCEVKLNKENMDCLIDSLKNIDNDPESSKEILNKSYGDIIDSVDLKSGSLLLKVKYYKEEDELIINVKDLKIKMYLCLKYLFLTFNIITRFFSKSSCKIGEQSIEIKFRFIGEGKPQNPFLKKIFEGLNIISSSTKIETNNSSYITISRDSIIITSDDVEKIKNNINEYFRFCFSKFKF